MKIIQISEYQTNGDNCVYIYVCVFFRQNYMTLCHLFLVNYGYIILDVSNLCMIYIYKYSINFNTMKTVHLKAEVLKINSSMKKEGGATHRMPHPKVIEYS